MKLRDRILKYIEYKGIDKSNFEKQSGLANGFVDKSGDNTRRSSLDKISNAFPDLNIDWILTGQGEMLKERNNLNNIINPKESQGVPYFEDIESTGSIMSMHNDYKETPTFFINYEHFNDCTAYMQHVGDSMYPKYCAGEIIAVKRIFNFDIVLWGEAYLIVTNDNANNLRTVKLVYPHEDESKIILRASNPNFKGDTVINKADIVSMFIVKGKITRNQL